MTKLLLLVSLPYADLLLVQSCCIFLLAITPTEETAMQIRIIIPNVVNKDNDLRGYLSAIARIAGGYTSSIGKGGFIMADGSLCEEDITIVDIAVVGTETRIADIPIDLHLLARRIARELNQECVYFAVDGSPEFVKP